MTPRPWHATVVRSHLRGMAVMLAVWWLLALMLMIQALALGEVIDEARSSLRDLQQTQAFTAARSGLDWGLAQADGAAPCPAFAAALPAIKSTTSALPDTAWLNCSWPWPAADEPGAAPSPQCRCASLGSDAPQPPGFALRYSRAAGSAWLLLQSTGCAADCDPLRGHSAQQSLLWRWLPAWQAAAAWPVAVLAGGRVSAAPQTPLLLDAANAWAVMAGDDALGPSAPASAVPATTVQGGRWDRLQGQTAAAGAALPADLVAWLATSPRTLDRLWLAKRWPQPDAADIRLIQRSGDWAVPAGAHLGSAQQPVLLRVDGTLRVDAPGVVITGLIVAGAVDISAGLNLDGALWVSGDVRLSGGAPIHLHHDAATVQAAWLRAGRFALQRGSWRDF
ncbi:hypothetical protein [Amphibiibacter pelophylacis]|uniref:Uncharacterized protein n=1 Tax=Amphibiibacter pelophylacis TaxID=1799477 RepID=A0ACC6P3Q1_9BURK